jgi:hypothetical protein
VASAGEWRHLAAVFLATKALHVAALLYGALYYFAPAERWNYLVYTDLDVGALTAFFNWDGQHYLKLAMQGYPSTASTSTAFFPLLPWLIRLVMQLGLHPIAAGLLLVSALSVLALALLQRLLPAGDRSPSSLWLLMCFPSAYYLSAVYTEALFLVLFFGLLWALRDARRAHWALLCAALLPLARGQGLWLCVPLAVAWLALLLRPAAEGLPARSALAAASAGYALGVLGYFTFYWWHYAHPLAGFYVQKLFIFSNTAGNLLDPSRFVDFLLRPPERFLSYTNAGFDKLMMLVSLLAMAFGMRRSRDPFLLAAWACFAVLPALMGEGGSYGRHALLAWACFVLAAGASLPRWAKWAILLPGFASQAGLAVLFGGNHWVG